MLDDTARLANAVFDAYSQEYEFWESVTEVLQVSIADALANRLLLGKVDGRPKSLGSALGKTYRKPESYGSLDKFKDLAGVRVIVGFKDQVLDVVAAIEAISDIEIRERDPKTPKPGELAYQAFHLIVRLSDEFLRRQDLAPISRPVDCEIQVQTLSQSLWAKSSHSITYKRNLPPEVERRVSRLVAICEVLDDELVAARNAALEAADVVDSVCLDLYRYYSALTGRDLGKPGPIELVAALLPNVVAVSDGYPEELDRFVTEHRPQLQTKLGTQVALRSNPILLRPEALFVFERLANAPFALRTAWRGLLPEDALDEIAAVWPSEPFLD